MKTGSWFLTFVLGLILCVAGCTTIADARNSKGKGSSRVYAASFDTVWETIPQAIKALGPGGPVIVGDNKQEGYFLAQGAMSMVSYGENVAIFVARVDDTTTEVEVVSKRALATNVVAANWETRIHKKLAELLKQVK